MISIITSLFLSDRHLKKFEKELLDCVHVLTKHGISFEVICVANDPTPKEIDFGKRLVVHTWFRFESIRRESLYATWNRGITLSHGAYITFWNVDDTRFPLAIIDGLEKCKNGSDLVYFSFVYKRYVRVWDMPLLVKTKIITPPLFDRKEFGRSMHIGPFFIFTKELYTKAGPFDHHFTICGDFEWSIRASQITSFTRSTIVAGIFKNEGTSLSGGRKNIRLIEENNRIYKMHNIPDKIIPIQ